MAQPTYTPLTLLGIQIKVIGEKLPTSNIEVGLYNKNTNALITTFTIGASGGKAVGSSLDVGKDPFDATIYIDENSNALVPDAGILALHDEYGSDAPNQVYYKIHDIGSTSFEVLNESISISTLSFAPVITHYTQYTYAADLVIRVKTDLEVNQTLIEDLYYNGTQISKVYLNGELVYSPLISFTIGETVYQAEVGMTWNDWVNSSYNILGASTVYSSVNVVWQSNGYRYTLDNTSLTDAIIAGNTYSYTSVLVP